MTPAICRMVQVLVDPALNNGSDVAPAVIARVWGEAADGSHTVNLRVLYDGPAVDWKTSASLYPDEAAARASGKTAGFAAFWPPRV